MDHQHHRHTNSHGRRDSSTLRRTQTFATPTTQGEESSVSSLGSLPAAHIVAQQFSTSKTSSQRRVMMDGSSFVMDDLVQDGRKIKVYNVRDDPSGANQRYCPHCRKQFTNPWAVPKHVMRVHNRGGEFHCARCHFRTPFQENLQQHEKDAHRKCPYCRQVFVLLNKHIGACPKRPH